MEEKRVTEVRIEGTVDGHQLEKKPVFNREELTELIKRATPNLSKIKDVDAWIEELRG